MARTKKKLSRDERIQLYRGMINIFVLMIAIEKTTKALEEL